MENLNNDAGALNKEAKRLANLVHMAHLQCITISLF